MFRKIGLMPIIAAASMALAGCGQSSNQASANNAATEANSAQANSAGQSTNASSGGAPTGAMCGGLAGIQCAEASDFCKMPTGQCHTPDAAGTCTRRPEICTDEHVPVCGCDGRTYDNACRAAAAGVNVQAAGECSAAAAGNANSAAAQ